MLKKLKRYYNKEYSVKSIYAVKTALMIFVLGLIIYYLAGKTGSVLSFAGAVLQPLVGVLVSIALLIAGGRIGGVVGMLVAVPIAALIKLQFERYMEA